MDATLTGYTCWRHIPSGSFQRAWGCNDDAGVTYGRCRAARRAFIRTFLSQVFAGQTVGIKQTDDHIWLVSFMD